MSEPQPDNETAILIPVECEDCGWTGHVKELLPVKSSEELLCPECKSPDWTIW